ncbi:trypsin-like peptidase domain-containing protein [bacterium]|nr:trypsin-like peptidase domain-containing protein [bacterium]
MQQESYPITKIVKMALPAVVSIVISKHHNIQKLPFSLPLKFEGSLQQPLKRKKIKVGGGSGFLVDEKGTILTNRHVVADSKADYSVILNNGEKYPAQILVKDPINDTAILKIEGNNFPFLKLEDTSQIELGETVIAIGNALGMFQNTVSVGVVSGLSRNIIAGSTLTGEKARLRGLIQTDAAVNPGNSGGPLINIRGKVIGINAAMVFGAENISFALPITGPKKDLEEFKQYGKIIHPFLGVRYILVDRNLQEKWGLPQDYGALIISEPQGRAIVPNSPAQKAGLKEYDIILEANGKKITPDNSLTDILIPLKIGEKIPLKVLRSKKEKTIMVTIGERP